LTKDSSDISKGAGQSAGQDSARPPSRGKLSLSRRQFWRVVTVAVASLPVAHQVVVRRRRRGEPGPTGWFGHC
jgi:anti-sigma-K factor RskA